MVNDTLNQKSGTAQQKIALAVVASAVKKDVDVKENPHNDESNAKKSDDGKFHLNTAENPEA